MTTTTDLGRSGTDGAVEEQPTDRPFPLLERQALHGDIGRLQALTTALGYRQQDWPYLAVLEAQRYRDAMLSYRQALVDLGHAAPLPVIWDEDQVV